MLPPFGHHDICGFDVTGSECTIGLHRIDYYTDAVNRMVLYCIAKDCNNNQHCPPKDTSFHHLLLKVPALLKQVRFFMNVSTRINVRVLAVA